MTPKSKQKLIALEYIHLFLKLVFAYIISNVCF